MCLRYLFGYCSPKKNRFSVQCPLQDINTLQNTTALKTGQIMHLYKCFCRLAKDSEDSQPLYLKKAHFLSLTSLQRNPILSTLLRSMFNDKRHLSFVDFAKYLSNFQALSPNLHPDQLEKRKQQKLRLIFNMYDHDKNGFISEEELMFLVDKLFGDIWSSEQIMNVVSMMITEMDTSNTNQILFDDFCKAFAIFDMEHWLVTKIPG